MEVRGVNRQQMRVEIKDRATYSPRVDIVDEPDHFVLTLDVPGAEAASVELALDKDVLTIRGLIDQRAIKGYELLTCGYESSPFERSFHLAAPVDQEGIEAKIVHGVLTLRLPKLERCRPKKIAVEVS